MKTRICYRCGNLFESAKVQAFCPDCKVGHCAVCGKEFTRTGDYPNRECCSRQCSGKYRAQTGLGKEVASKAKQTRLERYGTVSTQGLVNMKRICKLCGKEFETTSTRQIYCEGPHYGPCPNCGQSTVIKDISIGPQACCEACRQALIAKTTFEKYGEKYIFKTDYQKEKSKQTMLEKYGVEHYLQSDEGKQRLRELMIEKYGVDSPAHSEELLEKKRQTNIQRYGAPVPTMNEDVKRKAKETVDQNFGGFGLASPVLSERIRQTNLDRYGAEYPMQNESVKQKCQDTLVHRYGENPLQSEEIRQKRTATNIERYGVPVPSMSEEVQKKMKETNLEKYGVSNPFQSEDIKSRIIEHHMNTYGVSNPMQDEKVKQKARETCLSKYGNSTYKGSVEDARHSIMDPSKAESFVEFKKDPESFIKKYFSFKPTLTQIAECVGCDPATSSYYILKYNLKHLIEYRKSTIEIEMLQFLNQYLDESEIHVNDRQTIKPKELDFYIPKYHIGIECNPTYTHNSSKAACYPDCVIVPYDYHKSKTIACEFCGVRLIHVFGYQWTYHKDVVKSMILNAIGKTPRSKYARDLNIKEVSDSDSKVFLNENHIQGYTTSKVRLGLYSDEGLECLMTFSRKRATMGHTSADTQDDWELTRFCNKKYSRCVGGASKLFKYFIDQYHPNTIVSFSDRSNTSGNLYDVLGFEFVSYVEPGYIWVDPSTEMYYNRVKCQKHNLQKLFNDDTIDIENNTESQIMEEHGFVKVYNSGLVKWMWKSH